MLYIRTKFQAPISNCLLIITIKPETKYLFIRHYIAINFTKKREKFNKSNIFFAKMCECTYFQESNVMRLPPHKFVRPSCGY